MISVAILVTELELFSLNLDQLDLVSGTETDIRALAGIDVSDDCLDERAQIAWCAMVHFQYDGRIAVVFDRHSSAKIVGGGHRKC